MQASSLDVLKGPMNLGWFMLWEGTRSLLSTAVGAQFTWR